MSSDLRDKLLSMLTTRFEFSRGSPRRTDEHDSWPVDFESGKYSRTTGIAEVIRRVRRTVNRATRGRRA